MYVYLHVYLCNACCTHITVCVYIYSACACIYYCLDAHSFQTKLLAGPHDPNRNLTSREGREGRKGTEALPEVKKQGKKKDRKKAVRKKQR